MSGWWARLVGAPRGAHRLGAPRRRVGTDPRWLARQLGLDNPGWLVWFDPSEMAFRARVLTLGPAPAELVGATPAELQEQIDQHTQLAGGIRRLLELRERHE